MSHLIANADARRLPLADGSVHAVITSPPYWGLRDYKVAGQIGLEKTPDAYVAEMVAVFREVRRVLRDDGVAFLNLGDSYATGQTGFGASGGSFESERKQWTESPPRRKQAIPNGMVAGNLIGIPWRVALALQADGWILRSEIIWHKRSPMPESVKTRPTRAHEHVFLLAKSPKYFYDWYAVREKANSEWLKRGGSLMNKTGWHESARGVDTSRNCERGVNVDGSTRNLRSVWTLSSEPFPGSHFATFPRKLVVPCIKAGTSAKGCCPACGAQWVREVISSGSPDGGFARKPGTDLDRAHRTHPKANSQQMRDWKALNPDIIKGFRQSCPCPPHEPVPSVVLDPFGGAGTVPLVAEALGRRGIATELSPDYCRMALQRIRRPHHKHVRPDDGRAMPLFSGLAD